MKAALGLVALIVALIVAPSRAGAALGLHWLLGVWLPYTAVMICVIGLGLRLLRWASTPVPYAIPVSGGQIGASPLDAPVSQAGVVGRLALEVLALRSLLRDTRALMPGTQLRLSVEPSVQLWLAAMCLHYSLLVVALRHTRLCLEPVPAWVAWLTRADSWLALGTPAVCLSGLVLMLALIWLLARRRTARMRLLSLPGDYFPLVLLLALAASGLLMRHVLPIDLTRFKLHVLGLVRFAPGAAADPAALEPIALLHLTLACALLIYFPFSKLVHIGAVMFAPTRNLRCDTRAFRHQNPQQSPPGKEPFRSYAEYEAAFAPQLREAGLPLDSEAAVRTPPDTGKGGRA